MNESRTPAIAELQPGQVWLMDSPRRIARVIGPTAVNFINQKTKEPVSRHAIAVEVAIVTQEIPGHLDGEAAKRGRIIVQALPPGANGEPGKWNEIWSERAVHPVKKNKEGAAFVDDSAPMVAQTYVHDETGRAAKTRKLSPMLGAVIQGVLLDEVPEGIFAPVGAAPEDVPPPLVTKMAVQELPRNIMQLKSIAARRGVDVTDISGKGAVDRMIERLEVA